MSTPFSGLPAFIWSVADLLRGDFKQSQYGRVILPFTILRRLSVNINATISAAPNCIFDARNKMVRD